jgi:hypothetical protein
MAAIINRASGIAAFCLACGFGAGVQAQTKDAIQPTGAAGSTAFQPKGAARGEVEAATGPQNGNDGSQQAASKPGFDNKPPKGAKADCQRPQGGVDASGGENIGSSSKDNTSCTRRAGKPAIKK